MAHYGGQPPPYRYPPNPEPTPSDQTSAFVSKLLENGLAERVERMVQRQVEMAVANNKRDNRSVMGTDKLEPFDPDDPNLNVEPWILKYDELGEIYGWSDYEKMYLLKTKLVGRAREWYTRLDTKYPNLMWDDWKKELWRAFPNQQDFGTDLEELVSRRKQPTESMSDYFHSKVRLCERCGIDGPKAVSCIIRGLPEDLRFQAYALKCRDPESLLTGYFEMIDQQVNAMKWFRPPSVERLVDNGADVQIPERTYDRDRFEKPSSSSLENQSPTKRLRCYYCYEIADHKKKNCPKRQTVCVLCGKAGHTRRDCWRKAKK